MIQRVPEEIHLDLRKAVFKALKGIVYLGNEIPVYDSFAPSDAPPMFILMREQGDAPIKQKNRYATEAHMTIEAVTRFPISSGASEHRDRIAGYILKRLYQTQLEMPNHNVLQVNRQYNRTLEEQYDTERVMRRFMIFNFDLSQKISEQDLKD